MRRIAGRHSCGITQKRSSLRIFFNVVTVSFRVLYVFVIMEIGTRKMLHFNVTAHPTAEWTLQQFPGGDWVRARLSIRHRGPR